MNGLPKWIVAAFLPYHNKSLITRILFWVENGRFHLKGFSAFNIGQNTENYTGSGLLFDNLETVVPLRFSNNFLIQYSKHEYVVNKVPLDETIHIMTCKFLGHLNDDWCLINRLRIIVELSVEWLTPPYLYLIDFASKRVCKRYKVSFSSLKKIWRSTHILRNTKLNQLNPISCLYGCETKNVPAREPHMF